nr:AP-1 complex subunit gamma-2-like isoform X1 [Tanacetum cinerariifolium]
VVCTLGSIVFVCILIVRGVWTGLSYFQEGRYRWTDDFDDENQAWHALIVVITNASNLHGYAVRCHSSRQSKHQETLVRVAVYGVLENMVTFVISRRIKDIVTQSKGSLLLELQQRSIEFDSIIEKHQNI